MEKRVALFDLDGTLVDSTHIYWQVAQELCAKYTIPVAAKDYISNGGKPPRVWLQEKGVDPMIIEDFRHDYSIRARELLPQSQWMPGALELLKQLRELETPRAIITTARGGSLEAINKLSPSVIFSRSSLQVMMSILISNRTHGEF